ncbi:hypothetical protein D1BOALGB6SA_3159 [Olavius sp. associated proteobacterium Delta 1]|nr:hypothetical protein D1BOALGB6SA_3159 [Olavius sp. associated proteobacterium Delta 1]
MTMLYLNSEPEDKLWQKAPVGRNKDSLNPAPTQ